MAEPRALTEAGVSEREAEVLALVGARHSNAEIAAPSGHLGAHGREPRLVAAPQARPRQPPGARGPSRVAGRPAGGCTTRRQPSLPRPRHRSATPSSDGLNIAYQVTGSGDVDLVAGGGVRLASHPGLDRATARPLPAPPRHVLEADPVRQARHGHVGPARHAPRYRDPHGRRGGRDGRRPLGASRPLRVLRGRADVDPLRGQPPRAGAGARPLLQLCAAAVGARLPVGLQARGPSTRTPHSSSRTGRGRPTCATCAPTPTRSSPGGGASDAALRRAPAPRVPSSR